MGLILGLALGLVARREDGWGGYGSFRRRAARLGHIAAVMLPLIGGFYALALPATDGALVRWGAGLWVLGGVGLPIVLFAAAFLPRLRFALPVPASACVVGAVALGAREAPSRRCRMKIALIAMSGVRVRSRELQELGVTLPGFVERGPGHRLAAFPGSAHPGGCDTRRHRARLLRARGRAPRAAARGRIRRGRRLDVHGPGAGGLRLPRSMPRRRAAHAQSAVCT